MIAAGVDRHRDRHLAEVDPREQRLHVIERVNRHPLATHLAQRARMIGVMAHQRRHVKRRREPRLAVVEQIPEALVGLLRRPETRELPHRPKPPAVHRRVHPARERILARQGDARLGIRRQIHLRVQRPDRLSRQRRKRDVTLGRGAVLLLPSLERGLSARCGDVGHR